MYNFQKKNSQLNATYDFLVNSLLHSPVVSERKSVNLTNLCHFGQICALFIISVYLKRVFIHSPVPLWFLENREWFIKQKYRDMIKIIESAHRRWDF